MSEFGKAFDDAQRAYENRIPIDDIDFEPSEGLISIKNTDQSEYQCIENIEIDCDNDKCGQVFSIDLYWEFNSSGQGTITYIQLFCPYCKKDLTDKAFDDHNDNINNQCSELMAEVDDFIEPEGDYL